MPRKRELLPSLAKNIRCGNSLISYDIFDQLTLFDEEEKERINPFDWHSKSTGFGEIMKKGGFDVVIGNPPYVRQELFSDLKIYFKKSYKTYHGMADLYVYFVEKGFSFLKKDSIFGIIVSNKWLHTSYGNSLRAWMKNQRIIEIIDFGDLPVFKGATTYPCIIIMKNNNPKKSFTATKIKELDVTNFQTYIEKNRFVVNQTSLEHTGWYLFDYKRQKLLHKIKKTGIKLDQYIKGKIFRGVLTGFNQAFIVRN